MKKVELVNACLFLQLLQFEQVNKGIPAIISIDSTLTHMDKTLADVSKTIAHMDNATKWPEWYKIG